MRMKSEGKGRNGNLGFRFRTGWIPLVLAAGLLALPAVAQEPEVLTKIEVVGTQKLTPETVLFKAGLKEGDDLRNIDLTAVLEKLWATGSFDDIKFEVSDEKEGKKLTIRVKERPLIKEVDYRGGTEIGASTIKDRIKEKHLTINPDTVYDPEATRKVKDLLVDLAAEKGFTNPVIDVNLEPMGPTMARLVFDIKEGGKVRIYRIQFKGNKVISDAQLRSALKKDKVHGLVSWIMARDLLVQKKLDEDLENIKRQYWKKGYKDVFVGKPIVEVQDLTTERQKKKNRQRVIQGKSPRYDLRATLTIPILEGEQFMAGGFKLEGNEKLYRGAKGEEFYRLKIAEVQRDNRSWLARWFNLKPSLEGSPSAKLRPFDLDALNEGLDKVREAYADQGYITVPRRQEDDGAGGGRGQEGGRGRQGRRGRAVHRPPHRLRGQHQDQGQGAPPLHAPQGRGRVPDRAVPGLLHRHLPAGLLRRQEPGAQGGPRPGQAPGGPHHQGRGGRGERADVPGRLRLGVRLLPGRQLLHQEPGRRRPDPQLQLHPRPVPEERLDQLHRAVPAGHALLPDHQRRQQLGGLQRLPGGRHLRLQAVHPQHWHRPGHPAVHLPAGPDLGLLHLPTGWATVSASSGIEGRPELHYRNTGSQLTSTFNQTLTYNTVNHPFKPTTGQKFGIGFEYGGWQFGTDTPFYRTTLEYERVASITDRHIFAFNTSYGYLKNLSNGDLPVWDLYRPGRRELHPRLPLRPGGIGAHGQQPAAGGGGRQQAVHHQPRIPVQDC